MPHMTRDEIEQEQIRAGLVPVWNTSQKRTQLQIAAEGLTPRQVRAALIHAGLDPDVGLDGVPASREGKVCGFLIVASRGGDGRVD